MQGKFVELTGNRYGRWLVLAQAQHPRGTHTRWLCRCACGKEKILRSHVLLRGHSKSCGCFSRERSRIVHTTHGDSRVPGTAFNCWKAMKARCLNPNDPAYPRYGGRGIRLHKAWVHSYPRFLQDVGARPSPTHQLDRINCNGGYFPGNVRWVVAKVNSRNRRRSVWLTFNGKTLHLLDWARDLKMRYATLLHRQTVLKWPVKKVLSQRLYSGKFISRYVRVYPGVRSGEVTRKEAAQ